MPQLHHTLADAARCLSRGGALIFPTETFYALGCLASDAAAVARIYHIKGREAALPLPLLAADREQAAWAACLEAVPQGLFDRFWPGPLTVLLPARPSLPAALVNSQGKTAVRVSSHRQAAELARLAGGPLTASSANPHGRPAVHQFRNIEAALLRTLDEHSLDAGLFKGEPPTGGLPSTLVEPLETMSRNRPLLRLVRAGAVSTGALEAAGFCVRLA
ncbi:MAG: L-threonylcarbamoyladenylate synthase [Desulfovibrio sp.]|jgi:L-threonylcarbamoyladenylate synthase|nr:L-threonylcarbamoyladenylate synthase [Desulfovibrio sp.]